MMGAVCALRLTVLREALLSLGWVAHDHRAQPIHSETGISLGKEYGCSPPTSDAVQRNTSPHCPERDAREDSKARCKGMRHHVSLVTRKRK